MSENRYYGVYQGKVIAINDPNAMNRVRVLVPHVTGAADSNWAMPSSPKAPQPLIGALVWVAYNNGEPNKPVYFAQAFTNFAPTYIASKNVVFASGSYTFAHGAPFLPVAVIPVPTLTAAVVIGVTSFDITNVTLSAYTSSGAYSGTIPCNITYLGTPRT